MDEREEAKVIVKEVRNEFGKFCGGKSSCEYCKYVNTHDCLVAFAYDKGVEKGKEKA